MVTWTEHGLTDMLSHDLNVLQLEIGLTVLSLPGWSFLAKLYIYVPLHGQRWGVMKVGRSLSLSRSYIKVDAV
jgi:hypothetical protein